MVFQSHRREAPLKISHLGNQPAGQDGHQGTHEHHIAADGQQRGDKALPGPYIVTQVTGIGQPQESPPDGRSRLFKVPALGNHQKAADQRDQADKHTDHKKLKPRSLYELAFQYEFHSVDQPERQHGIPLFRSILVT